MSTETNQNEGADSQNDTVEVEAAVETVSVSKKDYDTMNQTLGSMKRQLKDLQKTKEPATETTKNQTEEFGLLHKSFLRSAGITDSEEVELARQTAKKWNVGIDEVVDDEDFKVKLEKHRTAKSNALATSNIKGGTGTQSAAKNTAEYWIAKGTPPTPSDVSDRKTRQAIVHKFLKAQKGGGKTFYND